MEQDLLDQVHSAQQSQPAAAPGGDLLDQVHAGAPVRNVIDDPANKLSYTTPEGIPVYQHPNHPEGVAGFGDAFWEGLGGKTLMDLIAGANRTPEGAERTKSAVKNLVMGLVHEPGRVWDELKASGNSMITGHPADAAFHLSGAVPLFGAPAQQVAMDFDNGDYARGFGHGLGLLFPFMAGAAKGGPGIGKVAEPMKVPSTLNPVEQGAVDFAQDRGIPLNAGTVTGNKFLKGAQTLAAAQPLGATVAARSARATESGLRRVAGELTEETHPNPATPESVGAAVPGQLKSKIADIGLAEDEAYAKAWLGRDNPAHSVEVPIRAKSQPVLDATGKPTGQTEIVPVLAKVNMPVDVRDIKDALKPVWDEMQWMPASDRASSAGFQAVKNILEGDDFIPAWQAEKGLSGLKAMARVSNQSGVRNTSQGIGASIIPDLQGEVDLAVSKTGEDAIRGLQQGRAFHASKMEVADLVDQFRKEPVQAFGQMTWRNDTGIDFLRKIDKQAPGALPQVGRAYLEQLFGEAMREGGFSRARTLLNRWEELGPETKKLFYPNPGHRADLGNFFKAATMVAENPNPSGTAVVGSLIPGGMLAIQNPVAGTAWLLGGHAAAKLLFSPAGVELLTKGMKRSTPAEAAAVAGRIVGLAGGDVRPIPLGAITNALAQPQQQTPR